MTETEKMFCGKGYKSIFRQVVQRIKLKLAQREFRKIMEKTW